MATYRGTANRPDKAKAMTGVVLVHAGLAALILTGLNVSVVRHTIEQMKTFDITAPPPPPPPPPPPIEQARRAKDDQDAAAPKALPTPIVAPRPKVVVPAKPPVAAAPLAGTGSASRAGAASTGSGTGAGGSGSGSGGGGNDFSGFTPAQLIRNIGRGDYRRIAGGRQSRGTAMVALNIEPDGQPTQCRIMRSSGDAIIDAGLCPLLTQRLRFRPALDNRGRPIPYQLQYVANWEL